MLRDKETLQNKIEELKKEYAAAVSSRDAKKAVFYEATINIYTKELKKVTR